MVQRTPDVTGEHERMLGEQLRLHQRVKAEKQINAKREMARTVVAEILRRPHDEAHIILRDFDAMADQAGLVDPEVREIHGLIVQLMREKGGTQVTVTDELEEISCRAMAQTRHIRLLAHNVRSLWNVGSMFRTSDAFAVEKFYLTGYTGYPPRKEISKTAIGADEWVPWEHAEDPVAILRGLRDEGWTIAALELAAGAHTLATYSPPDRICLVVGNELTGVPAEVQTLCDTLLKIPMLGRKESLNVSVATGIALHHLRAAALGPEPTRLS